MKSVCVFAGARGGKEMMPDMERVGEELARSDWNVIYGGSGKGVMGAVSKGVERAGGKCLGILPAKIHEMGFHRLDTAIEVVRGMQERKRSFWDCDAFLCLPGAVGTMDELFEIWTLQKLGYEPRKPIVVYNWRGFYTPLHNLLNNMKEFGTMPGERADMVKFAYNAPTAVALIGLPQPAAPPMVPGQESLR